jgi:hypothetical protein
MRIQRFSSPFLGGIAGGAVLLGLWLWGRPVDFVLVQRTVLRDGLFPGAVAPNFHLTGAQGERIGLEELKGEPFTLVFVTPTCPYCRQLKEEVLGLDLGHAADRLLFISGQAGAATLPPEVLDLEERLSRRFAVLKDTSRAVFNAYKNSGVPMTYSIDAEGRITAKAVGAPGSLELIRQVAEEAGKREPGVAFTPQR